MTAGRGSCISVKMELVQGLGPPWTPHVAKLLVDDKPVCLVLGTAGLHSAASLYRVVGPAAEFYPVGPGLNAP